MLKWVKTLWLDITNQTDEKGFTKQMRQQKKKLDKLHKVQDKARKNKVNKICLH